MPTTTSSTISQAARYQDELIQSALPAWLRKANAAQLEQLREASVLSLYWRERWQQILGQLQGVDAFCQPRLQHALRAQWPQIDVASTLWRKGEREPVITSQPIGYPVTTAVYRTQPLLEAALTNFTAEQAEPGGMLVGNRLQGPPEAESQLPDAAAFAGFCRTLDLGGQYQRHLHEVLETAPGEGPDPRSVLARHLRYALLVEVHRAWIEGHVDGFAHRLLSDVCNLYMPLAGGDPLLQVGKLRLLGHTLERIVVVDGQNFPGYADGSSIHGVWVYIPGDPHGALRGYASLRHFANDLGMRLRTPQYQRFFARFVGRRDSQRFFSAVIEGYAGVGDLANIRLDERVLACTTPVFDALAEAQIEQIKDDARMIAMPVADIDLDVQREHDQRLAAEGWTLLNLAGLFIPALGVALLAVTAWELLDQTYLGIAAWQQGEHSEAMHHLLDVAAQVATLAVVGGAGTVAAKAWSRSQWVDSLLPQTLGDGRVRLGVSRIDALRTPLPAQAVRDEQGLYQLGEQRWVELDGEHYPVSRADEDQPWALHTADGVVHPLSDNGASAWRLWHETPGRWAEPRYLFRRLSLTSTALDDEAIDLVLHATDTDADTLRALHVRGQTIDALLLDSLERVALDTRLRTLIKQLRGGEAVGDTGLLAQVRALPEAAVLNDQALAEHLWQARREVFDRVLRAQQAPASAAAQVLSRDFPGLTRRAAQALVDAGSVAERELLDSGRVPLRMALAARRSLRRIRVAKAYESLWIDAPQGLDLARLTLALSQRLPGVSERFAWRLFEHGRAGAPVWSSAPAPEARQLDLVLTESGFELFDGQGAQLSAAPGELFETLATGFDDAERQTLGVAEPFAHNWRVLVARQAMTDRESLPRLLGQRPEEGWFRLPKRLADGRVGYPLSGRGQRAVPASLGARVRRYYPLMNDQQVEVWAQQIRDSGQQVEQVLTQLGIQARSLERSLRRWVRGGTGILVRNDRNRFADHLLAAWRRLTPHLFPGVQQTQGFHLRLRGIYLPMLPRLPAEVSFAHVHTLSLQQVGLHDVGPDFLARFPQLRVLELDGNILRRVPRDLNLLTELRELSLDSNEINLDDEQVEQLAGMRHLQLLSLASNPLRRSFSVRDMPNLRYLNLSHTEQTRLPPGLLGRMNMTVADLRHNRIRTLPDAYFSAPQWVNQGVLLDDNPLDAATMARFDSWNGGGAAAAPTVTAPTASAEAEAAAAAVRDAWLLQLPEQPQLERAALWEELRTRDGAEGLFDLLDRLRQSADFHRLEAGLGTRVWAVLDALHAHADLAEEVFALANLPLTCQDSAALSFSGLELHLLVWRALREAHASARSQEQALIRLGRQLWRLDEVERIALRDLEARRADGANPDQIEVVLAYRVGLREALDLPAQPHDMLFAAVSGVDPVRLEEARVAVLTGEQQDVRVQALAQRDFWRTWLERHYADRFEAMDAPFQARLAALMEQVEAGASVEGEYLSRMNAVRDEREASRTALILSLTEEILEAHAAQ
ncbi:NEL-type E3 ubiquitin ligase domain-containing protein [Pseudomonas sp. UBA6562]|uniref:NEL-type E3 ubiquitin ligase domain-containing protein n=1 Tax=Pseudomonas sp. UBA6562 TaxID=1947332 RepID=UPI0025EB05F9|nr:NEL-type E3 ubiquitin ligase domain-containing protein [Pseudomonas sp. UBA6562]